MPSWTVQRLTSDGEWVDVPGLEDFGNLESCERALAELRDVFGEDNVRKNRRILKSGTKFGSQPFLKIIQGMDKERREAGRAGLTYRQVAAEIGVAYLHLRHAGYGYVRPKDELRRGLADFLGMPVEELFTEESLASKPHYGEKGRLTISETPQERQERVEREREERAARLAEQSAEASL